MDDKQFAEVDSLLNEVDSLLDAGNVVEAKKKLSKVKDKLRPIGAGSNGPEPRKP